MRMTLQQTALLSGGSAQGAVNLHLDFPEKQPIEWQSAVFNWLGTFNADVGLKLAEMMAADLIWLSPVKGKTFKILLNVNDYFGPGSDAEEVIGDSEIESLYIACVGHPESGPIYWTAVKRNRRCWRDKYRDKADIDYLIRRLGNLAPKSKF